MSKKLFKKLKRAAALALSVVLMATSVSMDAQAGTSAHEWADYGVFKGTVFGNVGGSSKINDSYYFLGADDAGDMRVAGVQKSSKISSGGDGFGMYYYAIKPDSEFTFSATATVNNAGDGSQSAFGLMVRDDIVHNDDTVSTTNYAVAGMRSGNGENCFARTSTSEYASGGSLATNAKPEAGSVYNLSIKSSDAGYVCQIEGEEAHKENNKTDIN